MVVCGVWTQGGRACKAAYPTYLEQARDRWGAGEAVGVSRFAE